MCNVQCAMCNAGCMSYICVCTQPIQEPQLTRSGAIGIVVVVVAEVEVVVGVVVGVVVVVGIVVCSHRSISRLERSGRR